MVTPRPRRIRCQTTERNHSMQPPTDQNAGDRARPRLRDGFDTVVDPNKTILAPLRFNLPRALTSDSGLPGGARTRRVLPLRCPPLRMSLTSEAGRR